jgi:1-acyl-sn-glycerol-3-phosphate acyltransferase
MHKIISYPISVIYYFIFGLLLCFFHPIQWVCFNIFGYQAHKKSVDYLNFGLVSATRILGTTYKFYNLDLLPKNTPLIFVANHQSLYDIPAIIWFMRKSHPKFISKKELGKGIPSVSFNLRHGGSVLIDRKDAKQAIPKIQKIAQYIENHQRSVVIFPEGTRSKTGIPKKFSENGLKVLCKYAPSALIVPISINNSWKMVRFGMFPMGLGNTLTFTIHKPLSVRDYPFEQIINNVEHTIVQAIKL